MSKIIKVENLSKKYIIGHQQLKGKKTFREAISQNIANFGSKFVHPFSKNISSNSPYEELWALKDINFEVEQGNRIGIIGKNGAGKSTLLKVLSRITEPSTGKITIKGRVASLLEVGTGFSGELTGRENVFLNGAILGMHHAEIKQKFDEIVDFSGVEKFLDTPVKRYSSGMYVRLAFAVAAHLEPEILVVDEVLAVGDAEFQKKCLGKMKEVSKQGRTVLFVSHNMAAIKSLCSRGIILANGISVLEGDIESCVAHYLKGNNDLTNHKVWNGVKDVMNDDFELIEIGVRGKDKDYSEIMRIDEPIEFIAIINQKNPNKRIDVTLHIKDDQGNKLFSTGSGAIKNAFDLSKGHYQIKGTFPANFYNWGNFFIDLYIVENKRTATIVIEDIISFTLSNKELELGTWMGREPGGIMPVFHWGKEKLVKQ
ncbi:MAG: ATP-binding cassette domain-containing protein [Bacteroidetes bacterium]|nr:MAG: ATP-binding cassette domain-containing protein [Bacteroidota bacterium]